MPWKNGKIKFADGSTYDADLLIEKGNQIWNVKIHKGNDMVEEVDAHRFAAQFGKTPEQVYPFTYEVQ